MSVGVIAGIEALESRRMFAGGMSTAGGAAFIDGATLRIVADARRSTNVRITTEDDGETILVAINGRGAQAFSKETLASVLFTGGRGQDRVTVREDGGRIDLPLIIRTGAGGDYVDLDETEGRVAGGDGNDTLLGSSGDDRMDGEAGNDRVFGGRGFDLLRGGGGNDDIRGDDGDDTLIGERGNDVLDGGFGSDELDGGDGRNRLVDRARRGEFNIFYGGLGRNDIFRTTTDEFRDIDHWFDRVYLSRPLNE